MRWIQPQYSPFSNHDIHMKQIQIVQVIEQVKALRFHMCGHTIIHVRMIHKPPSETDQPAAGVLLLKSGKAFTERHVHVI